MTDFERFEIKCEFCGLAGIHTVFMKSESAYICPSCGSMNEINKIHKDVKL